jgi:hypothetical protein
MVAPVVPAANDLRAILINNNAERTNNPIVDLILSAQFAPEMMISNDPNFVGASFEPYVTAKEHTLLDEQVGPGFGDGTKTVYVKFRSATLVESDIFSASLILDTQPPLAGPMPILINDGNLETNSRDVILTLDATGAETVEVFNENELETFTEGTIFPYSEAINWQLSEGNGQKKVLVAFIDDTENRSAFFSDGIILTGQPTGDPVITNPTTGTITTDHFITIKGEGDPGSKIRIDINGGV